MRSLSFSTLDEALAEAKQYFAEGEDDVEIVKETYSKGKKKVVVGYRVYVWTTPIKESK